MNVLITGAASGMGLATAELFCNNGHCVFGIDISKPKHTSFCCFCADITDESSLLQVKTELEKQKAELDLIINFAGIFFMDNYLEFREKDILKIIDVNVIGAMRVNKIFFPLLKKDGRIIVTTSETANRQALPFNGIYGVTKTALDSYAQALRHEAGLLGIKVITIRPGAVDTPLANGSIPSMKKMTENSLYFGGQAKRFESLMSRFTGKMLKPVILAERVYKISCKKRPKYIYTIHPNKWLFLLSLLPASVQVGIVRMLINKK